MKESIKKTHKLIGNNQLKLFVWFLETFYPTKVKCYTRHCQEFINLLNKRSENRGKRETVKHNKLCRLSVTRYLAGTPFNKLEGVKLTKDGLPKVLYFIHPLLRARNIDDLKIILTMLNLTRSIYLEPLIDHNPIINPWEGVNPISWNTFRSAVMRTFGRKEDFKYNWTSFHMSAKKGPNGQAIISSMKDFEAISNNAELLQALQKLSTPFKLISEKLLQVYDGSPLFRILDIWSSTSSKELITRKIVDFSDREGKTRTIGILDYWSQTNLKPIHDSINRILAKIEEDCTFNQDSFIQKLPNNAMYHSFDLSNATDRLPAVMQEDILSYYLGKRKASYWRSIMVNTEFHTSNGNIRYGCGQPMGGYSSWPIMALQHHALVRLAAISQGVPWKGKYIILGDDIVIACEKIAEEYRNILDTLKVPISNAKTHISKDIYEFAKRWVFKGIEITPYPLHSIKSNYKRYYLLENSFDTAEKMGYKFSDMNHKKTSVLDLLKIFNKGAQAPRIWKLLRVFNLVARSDTDIETNTRSMQQCLLEEFRFKNEFGNKILLEENKELFKLQFKDIIKNILNRGGQNDFKELEELKDKRKEKISFLTERYGEEVAVLLDELDPLTNLIVQTEKRNLDQLEKAAFGEGKNADYSVAGLIKFYKDWPRMSTKLITQRSHHAILATQARVVKRLLDVVGKELNKPLFDRLAKRAGGTSPPQNRAFSQFVNAMKFWK